MEVIESLEGVSRGPYTGAIGYLGFNETSHLSIAIRTAVKTRNLVTFGTGAGIVFDSDPHAEFAETTAKASGFLDLCKNSSQSIHHEYT
jgi:anthranilate/para-aminobenzoate synthase component I